MRGCVRVCADDAARLCSPFATYDIPGISSLPHPEGEPCTMYQFCGCLHLHAFFRLSLVFSRALARAARRGAACTPRGKFGSRVGSVARAPGVQSREIWQLITGLLSAELEPSKTMENPHVSCLLHSCTSSLLCSSHGTTAVAHQVCVDHYYACADIAYAFSVLCVL